MDDPSFTAPHASTFSLPCTAAPPASSSSPPCTAPSTSSLPWPGLMTCLAGSGDQRHNKFINKEHLKAASTSSKTKPRKEKKLNSAKKTEKKELQCDYCDKIFDVREIDTIDTKITDWSAPLTIKLGPICELDRILSPDSVFSEKKCNA